MPAPSPVCGIAAASAAMRQIDEDLDALEDDIVRLVAFDIGDEADAAVIVFILRMIQTLGRWQAQEGVSARLVCTVLHPQF